MKKIFTYLMLFASTFLLQKLKAQNYYSLNASLSSYADLVSPVSLNNTDSIAEAYYASGDVVFPVYGEHVNFNLDQNVPSLGAYITRYGYLAVYESPSYAYTMVFHGAFSNYHRRDASSSISVKYEGNSGSGILKFQWKNMGIDGLPDSNYVNFQIWFNEGSKTISYHYGPSVITGDITPAIGIFRAPNNFSMLTHASYVMGNIATPSSLTLASPATFNQINSVNGFPPANTVYTFVSNTTGIVEAGREKEVSIYPNPVAGSLFINTAKQGGSITITDVSGKIVLQQNAPANGIPVDVSSLSKGIYWMNTGEGKPVKFIKE
jgi:hypothetical protein